MLALKIISIITLCLAIIATFMQDCNSEEVARSIASKISFVMYVFTLAYVILK